MSLAATLIENGQFKLAASFIRSALAKTPANGDLLFDAANLLRVQGDIDGCRAALIALHSVPDVSPKARVLLDVLSQRAHDILAPNAVSPVPFARMENVLSKSALDELLSFAIANEHRFVDSKVKAVGRVDTNARRSKVWQGVTGLPPVLDAIVAQAVVSNAARLGVHEPLADVFEIEISAYRDGDFITPHWDRGDGVTRVRRITTLFYFHAMPARFTGGDLQLYDTGINGDFDRAAWTSFKPAHNSLLQFRSEAIHAVSRVSGPTSFAENRFCLTFWAHERQRI